jgi:hypothetical protein
VDLSHGGEQGSCEAVKIGGRCNGIFRTKIHPKKGKMKRKTALVAGESRKFLIIVVGAVGCTTRSHPDFRGPLPCGICFS